MHRCQHFFNVLMHSWKAFLGMLRKCASEFVLIASIDSKRQPFSVDFSFGNRKKSAGARSGEYGGCGRTVVACWPRSHVNSILFLIIRQQAWHKFGCNAMHAQIFGKNCHDTLFLRYSLLQLPLELSNEDLNGWLHELLQHYRKFSTLMAVPNADHHQPKFGPLWNVSNTRTFQSCPWLLTRMLFSTFQMSQ